MSASTPPDRVRQLEDAVLALWAEFPVAGAIFMEREAPRLVAFVRRLERDMSHEERMMRRNVWSEDGNPNDEP